MPRVQAVPALSPGGPARTPGTAGCHRTASRRRAEVGCHEIFYIDACGDRGSNFFFWGSCNDGLSTSNMTMTMTMTDYDFDYD